MYCCLWIYCFGVRGCWNALRFFWWVCWLCLCFDYLGCFKLDTGLFLELFCFVCARLCSSFGWWLLGVVDCLIGCGFIALSGWLVWGGYLVVLVVLCLLLLFALLIYFDSCWLFSLWLGWVFGVYVHVVFGFVIACACIWVAAGGVVCLFLGCLLFVGLIVMFMWFWFRCWD